jgi:hypothetical protein
MQFLRRKRVRAGDGKYDFRIVPAPQAGAAQESVFLQEFPNPLFPLAAGAGVVTLSGLYAGTQFRALQRPQVIAPLVAPVLGPGGIPSPDQSFILQGLEDNPGE